MSNAGADDSGHAAKVTRLTPRHLQASEEKDRGQRSSLTRSPYQIPDAPPEPRELSRDDEPAPPDESWSHETILESESYTRSAFYTQSSHGDEQTVVMKFAISKSVMRRFEEIVEQRRFPELAVKADAFRDAAHHRLHDYALMMNQPRDAEMVSRIEKTLSVVALTNALQDQQAHYERSKELYDTVRLRIEALREANNTRGIERVLRDAAGEIDNLEEPWASRLRAFVEMNGGSG